MKTVLITGAHGFLGRHCAREFGRRGWRVIGMGHGSWPGESPEAFGIHRWIGTDVDLAALRGVGERVDLVVHCAGSGSVGFSCLHPAEDFRRTVDTTLAALEFVRLENPGARVIYPSSAAVYGSAPDHPIREDDPLNPVSPYGFHKRIAEELCRSYAVNFGLDAAVIRFFSVYGAGLKKQLLWDACARLSRGKGSVEFFGTGDETRDWLHVDDAVGLIRAVSQSPERNLLVNGGSGVRTSVRQVLTLAAEAFGTGRAITFNGATREGDPRYYHADVTRALGLGWRPAVRLEDGIRDYVRWYRGMADHG